MAGVRTVKGRKISLRIESTGGLVLPRLQEQLVCPSRSRLIGATLERMLSLVQARRSLQRLCNARTNVCSADMSLEFRLLHQLGGLLASTAQEECAAGR